MSFVGCLFPSRHCILTHTPHAAVTGRELLPGAFSTSVIYCKNYAALWYNVPGAFEWMLNEGRASHQNSLDQRENGAAESPDTLYQQILDLSEGLRQNPRADGGQALPKPPPTVSTLCSHCQKASTKLRKCTRFVWCGVLKCIGPFFGNIVGP